MLSRIKQPIYAFVLLILVSALQSACVPFAVPIPWFPTDPHGDFKKSFDGQAYNQADVIREMGHPFAASGNDNWIYIFSKPSSFLMVGVATYGGYADGTVVPMTSKDFVLSLIFDDSGKLVLYESFSDSLLHDYCFESGVCFTRETLNVPVLPPRYDVISKQFELPAKGCSLYVYRDTGETGRHENDYVDVRLHDAALMRAVAAGASVEGGYHHWTPQEGRYRLELNFQKPREYPFDVMARTTNRENFSRAFRCHDGEQIFVQLFVPRSSRKPAELDWVDETTGKTHVAQLKRLMDLY